MNGGADFTLAPEQGDETPYIANLRLLRSRLKPGAKSTYEAGKYALRQLSALNKKYFSHLPGMRKKRNEMAIGFFYYFLARNNLTKHLGRQPSVPQFLGTRPNKQIARMEWMLSNMPLFSEMWQASDPDALYLHKMPNTRNGYRLGLYESAHPTSPIVRLPSTANELCTDRMAACRSGALVRAVREQVRQQKPGFYRRHGLKQKKILFSIPYKRRLIIALSMLGLPNRFGLFQMKPKQATRKVVAKRPKPKAMSPRPTQRATTPAQKGLTLPGLAGGMGFEIPELQDKTDRARSTKGRRGKRGRNWRQSGRSSAGSFAAVPKGYQRAPFIYHAPILQQIKQVLRYVRGGRVPAAYDYQNYQIVSKAHQMNKLAFPSGRLQARERMVEMIFARHQCIFIRRAVLGRFRIFNRCKVCFGAGGKPSPNCPRCHGALFQAKPPQHAALARKQALTAIRRRAFNRPELKRALYGADAQLVRIEQKLRQAQLQSGQSSTLSVAWDNNSQKTCYFTHPVRFKRNKNFIPESYSYATRVLMSCVCPLEFEILHMLNAWSVLYDHLFGRPKESLWTKKPSEHIAVLKDFVVFHAIRAFPTLAKTQRISLLLDNYLQQVVPGEQTFQEWIAHTRRVQPKRRPRPSRAFRLRVLFVLWKKTRDHATAPVGFSH